jgi:uncharacterized ferritin-like protein (DUF455 family)
MPPNTSQEWIEVARERAADAELLKQRLNSVGAVYMAGRSRINGLDSKTNTPTFNS